MTRQKRTTGARAWLIAAIALVCVAGVHAQEKDKPAAVNLTGKWTMSLEMEAMTATPALELKQDGEKVTGTYTSSRYGTFPIQGKIKDRAVEFTVKINVRPSDVRIGHSCERSPRAVSSVVTCAGAESPLADTFQIALAWCGAK